MDEFDMCGLCIYYANNMWNFCLQLLKLWTIKVWKSYFQM